MMEKLHFFEVPRAMLVKKVIAIMSLAIILLSVTGCSTLKKTENHWTQYSLIAHAAGGIDEHEYTNSLEAFHRSYEKGFRLIEVDVSITKDGRLVARHTWDEDYGQNLSSKGKPVTYREFMNSPIYGKYTPMDFEKLLNLMEEYKDVYVIIDGKTTSVEDTKRLYKRIGNQVAGVDKQILNRLIPQMFYEADLEIIRSYGFQDVLYVIGREEYTSESIARYCQRNNIPAVSLSAKRTNDELINTLAKYDIAAYMYTFNDVEVMKTYYAKGIRGFFTDFIEPADIKDVE